jgi:hypothetical protein
LNLSQLKIKKIEIDVVNTSSANGKIQVNLLDEQLTVGGTITIN